MTGIKTLERRVEALEPEPPYQKSDYEEYLSRCTVQELRDLERIAKRLEKLPEDEQVLTSSECEIIDAIEGRLGILG
jgi:DNA polymerase III delta prime subunit